MGFFSKLAEGIKKTTDSVMEKFEMLVNSFTKIDEEFFDELEELLITCDIGVETSDDICSRLRGKVKEKGLTKPSEIKQSLKEIIAEMLGEDRKIDTSTTPSVILVIGVNGAGKTTTIGKLAAKYRGQGKTVLVAAADTFRAAAIEQLEVWTNRAGADIVKHSEGSDPSSVIFDAVTAAKARQTDLLICDTAGRLHNKKNLMDELRKMSRIIHEQAEGCSLETLLVLDATTGQNAVNQARLFSQVADITGIVLTKLDGTAKGGIIISIHNELGIPVKLVGVGEKLDDLQEFNARDFVEALFDNTVEDHSNYERLTEGGEPSAAADDITEEIPVEAEVIPQEAAETESEPVPAEEIAEEQAEEPAAEVEEEAGETEAAEDESEPEDSSAEENKAEPAAKKGKFDWLFTEITFGKKKPKHDDKTEDDS